MATPFSLFIFLYLPLVFPIPICRMLIFYVIFFFLILRFAITLFNFISNPKLLRARQQNRDSISVLIPVRNEQKHILRLLKSIKEQDYTNYEVLILDDASSDNTRLVINQFIAADPRFRLLEGRKLPQGWTGKNFACHQLAEQGTGKYMLFLDADIIIAKGFLNSIVHRAKTGRLALLSIFPDMRLHTLTDYLVLPIIHFLLLNLVPLRLVRLSRSAFFSASSGQCMLFESEIYRAHRWHAQVKSSLAEDTNIFKIAKVYGYGVETLLANHYVCSERKERFSTLIESLSKHLLAEFNNNIPGLLCYFLLVMIGPLFIIAYLDLRLVFFTLSLILLARLMISLASKQNPLINIVVHPTQMLILLFVFVKALWYQSRQSFSWKGRRVYEKDRD